MPLFIGIDLGTSGCRAVMIDENNLQRGFASTELPAPIRNENQVEQNPQLWWLAVQHVLFQLVDQISELPFASQKIESIAVDGTSSTTLIVDKDGEPLGPALMYNDSRAQQQANLIKSVAPKDSPAASATSSLAKLLWFSEQDGFERAAGVMHQADWIAAKLTGKLNISDLNNCLKLGYDAENLAWPDWMKELGLPMSLLPTVYTPGVIISTVDEEITENLMIPSTTKIVAGTTDSTASFLASGANKIGEAVTTLGSTLVLKVISEKPVWSHQYGIYSQPLFDKWLVGGASNSGGAVLKHYFNDDQIESLSLSVDASTSTDLNYYPLPSPGERFPINDTELQAKLTPRPDDDSLFFQGILEGIADIEKMGYDRLAELGAPYPLRVLTMGGGAKNSGWMKIRAKKLGLAVTKSSKTDAAYGAALLAKRHFDLP